MRSKLVYEAVDIRSDFPCPEKEEGYAERTLGDLHGNTMKLLFFLLKEGILVLSEKKYQRLWAIYDKPAHALHPRHWREFMHILQEASYHPGKKFRLIGDVFADRGNNDGFTWLVLVVLAQKSVPFEILHSNHDMGFIRWVYGKLPDLRPTRSLENLCVLIERGIVSKKDIHQWYKAIYLPHLKALSYSLTPDQNPAISIFTHAPVGLETVKGVAYELRIPYDESTPETLANTIDQINQTFKAGLNSLDSTENPAIASAFLDLLSDPSSSLYHLIWNRDRVDDRQKMVKRLHLAPNHKGFSIKFVHGHDGPYTATELNRNNIDSDLGKSEENEIGIYIVHKIFTSPTANLAPKVGLFHLPLLHPTSGTKPNLLPSSVGRGEEKTEEEAEPYPVANPRRESRFPKLISAVLCSEEGPFLDDPLPIPIRKPYRIKL